LVLLRDKRVVGVFVPFSCAASCCKGIMEVVKALLMIFWLVSFRPRPIGRTFLHFYLKKSSASFLVS
jgi:hypothetical protein